MGKGLIVGIVGHARSGKDTFAQMLAEELFDVTRKRFILMAYAQELKLRVQRDFDFSYEQLWGDEKEIEDRRYKKKCIPGADNIAIHSNSYWTPREVMQFIGTECMRSVDDAFWTKALFKSIEDNDYNNVIITDIRFPDEAAPIVERNGYIIKITSERDGKPIITGSDHSSETSMDNYEKIDFHVRNDSTITDLRSTANTVAKFLIKSEKMKTALEEQNGKTEKF